MNTIGWGALFVFLFCMFSLGLMPMDHPARWVILTLALVAFLAGFFAFGGHRQVGRTGGDGIPKSDPTRSSSLPIHRPVSPYLARKANR